MPPAYAYGFSFQEYEVATEEAGGESQLRERSTGLCSRWKGWKWEALLSARIEANWLARCEQRKRFVVMEIRYVRMCLFC